MPERSSASPFESYTDRWTARLLADPEFRAGALELIEQAAVDAGLRSPVDPGDIDRLLRAPRIQQQFAGLALGVMRDMGYRSGSRTPRPFVETGRAAARSATARLRLNFASNGSRRRRGCGR